jgi:hypothetical protein
VNAIPGKKTGQLRLRAEGNRSVTFTPSIGPYGVYELDGDPVAAFVHPDMAQIFFIAPDLVRAARALIAAGRNIEERADNSAFTAAMGAVEAIIKRTEPAARALQERGRVIS